MVTKITGIKNPSPYWLLKIMAITRLVLGHYSNISGLKSISNLLKFYCILVCFSFSLVYFWDVCNKRLMSFHSISIFENIFISIIYFYHGDQLFTKFFSAIETNDRIVGFKNISLIPSYVYDILTFNVLMRIVNCLSYAAAGLRSYITFYNMNFVLFALSINHLTIIVIFSVMQN